MSRPGNRRHYKVERLKCRKMIDQMLADGYIYDDIVQAVFDQKEFISASALQRYHMSFERIAERYKKAQDQMKVLVETIRENPNTDLADAASQIMLQGLFQRLATAGEEFDSMPLDKAGRLVTQLSRATIARESLNLRMGKAFDLAEKKLMEEIGAALGENPELKLRLAEIVRSSLEKAKEESGD
jgi:Protein of unknown function (DUF3486).